MADSAQGRGSILGRMNKLFFVLVFLCLLVWVLTDVFGVGNIGGKAVFLTRRNILNVLN
ncbi:MAG: hypothetical protein LIQ31_12685 [Planctomycetes bacterium]|nr:hypothetical protein [Planctomycetota bacterium]